MFPTQSTSGTATDSSTTSTGGKTFNFDLDAGEFVIKDGKLQTLTGFEALKMWIKKALKTKKNKFRIYGKDGDYGVTLLDFINSDSPFAFIKAEIQREITEMLLTNDEIKAVGNFSFERGKRTLIVTFTINTIYGTTGEEVTI